ncbi:MAG: hypothetical protein K2X93_07375 [Candidatus Obscuribacterales bacterium]|nr:hypothetical protein [Candidatus Obscuribacterales bacterium]
MFNLIIALVFSITCLLPAIASTFEDKSPSPSSEAAPDPGAPKEAPPQAVQPQSPTDSPQAVQPKSPTDTPPPKATQSQPSIEITKSQSPPTANAQVQSTSSAATETRAPVAGESNKPAPSYDDLSQKALDKGTPGEAAEGPLLKDRRNIRSWLVSVKQRGVGIGFYLPLYEEMESGVRAGVPEQVTNSRVQAICAKMAAQVKESSRLQSWRPVRPPKEKKERPVYWIGERRDDDALKMKANDWYNNALHNLVDKDDQERREVQSQLWRQRDAYLKDMREKWGGPQWEGYGNNDNLKKDNQVEPLWRAPRKDLQHKK